MTVLFMSSLCSAFQWLHLGVDLVPVQPGSKRLVAGYGAYRRRIRDVAAARFWFADRRAGLAVVCGSGCDDRMGYHPSKSEPPSVTTSGLAVLDFDDPALYERWRAAAGSAAQSYTVRTPRGYHVYLWGDTSGIVGVEGLDVLGPGRVSVTSPTAGYRDVGSSRSIVSIKNLSALPLLSKKGPVSVSSPSSDGAVGDADDVVSAIKAAYPIVQIAEDAGIKLRSSDRGRGRWFTGLCPFHDDTHPSLWVDSERGLWGCRACGLVGDVINLYARLNRTDVRGAINELAARLRGASG